LQWKLPINCHLSEITELEYISLIKIIILEENFKWHLEAFASELFIWTWILTTGQTPRKFGLRFWLKCQNPWKYGL